MTRKSALSSALELYSLPSMAKQLRKNPLPDDVLLVIKAAAGAPEGLSAFPAHVSADPEKVREVAAFYIQQVMFMSHGGDLSVLGLPSGAGEDKIREHKRWLLKWLHPDRNNNRWEQTYFLRVSEAAQRALQHISKANPVASSDTPPAHSRRNAHSHHGRVRRSPTHAWHSKAREPNLFSWGLKGIVAVVVFVAAIMIMRNLIVGGSDLFPSIPQTSSGANLAGT